jgi:hypothetical protein
MTESPSPPPARMRADGKRITRHSRRGDVIAVGRKNDKNKDGKHTEDECEASFSVSTMIAEGCRRITVPYTASGSQGVASFVRISRPLRRRIRFNGGCPTNARVWYFSRRVTWPVTG